MTEYFQCIDCGDPAVPQWYERCPACGASLTHVNLWPSLCAANTQLLYLIRAYLRTDPSLYDWFGFNHFMLALERAWLTAEAVCGFPF